MFTAQLQNIGTHAAVMAEETRRTGESLCTVAAVLRNQAVPPLLRAMLLEHGPATLRKLDDLIDAQSLMARGIREFAEAIAPILKDAEAADRKAGAEGGDHGL